MKKNFLNILLVAILLIPFYVFADETYTITDYGEGFVIEDSLGNVLAGGNAFCLDSKSEPPSPANPIEFKRKKLSEMTSYNKAVHPKTFNDSIRARLLKIIMATNQIKQYSKNLYTQKGVDSIIDYIVDHDLTVLNFSDVSGDEAKELKRTIIKRNMTKFFDNPIEPLIWTAVYDKNYWDTFMTDENDNYFAKAFETYYYISPDPNNTGSFLNPKNDQRSLWNIFYAPMLDYIDNQITNYYTNGYDAWIYYTEDVNTQNLIGTPFYSTYITIAKVDESGNYLKGASLQLLDSNRNVIESWTSTTEPHKVSKKLVNGNYIIHEVTPPTGYLSFTDKTVTINFNKQITSTATIKNDIITVSNQKKIEEPTYYTVTPNPLQCCEISVTNADLKKIQENETVTFRIIPTDNNYSIKLSIYDQNGNNVNYKTTQNANEYSFTMPKNNVQIKAECELIEKEPEPTTEPTTQPTTIPTTQKVEENIIHNVPATASNTKLIIIISSIIFVIADCYLIYQYKKQNY